MFCTLSVDVWAETLSFSIVLPLNNTQNIIGRHFNFYTLMLYSLFKSTAPKVLWEEGNFKRSN